MGQISGVSTSDLNNVDGFFTSQTGGGGGGGTATATPQTASIVATQYSDQTLTISNTASYTDGGLNLAVFCEIKSGSVLVTPNTSMSYDQTNGKLTWADGGTPGTRTFSLKVQDFGLATSSLVTGNYTRGSNARTYWRYSMHATSHAYVKDIKFYDDVYSNRASATSYPSTMTATDAPSPYEITQTYQYSSNYAGWKAFDNNSNTGWWNLGAHTNQYNDSVTAYMGSTERTILSAGVVLHQSYNGNSGMTISIEGANNADFTQDYLILVSSQSKSTDTEQLNVSQ